MITLVVRLLWLLGWGLTLPWRLVRSLAPIPGGTYVLVEIDGTPDDAPSARKWWPPRPARHFSLYELALLVDEIARDPRIAGLVVVAKSVHGGFAAATSLRNVLLRVRASGKQLVVHLPHGGGTKETYVGVAADRLLLGPRAPIAPLGVLARPRYVRGALDRAGLVPDVYARGRYKTAAEPLERTSMSEPQREQLEKVLDRFHRELLQGIAEGRHLDEAAARAIVDDAPYVGERAAQVGLVDGVAYEDELRGRLSDGGPLPGLRRANRYLGSRRALRLRALEPIGAIGVLRIHGVIAGAPGPAVQAMAVADQVIAAVRLARANPLVRGVVMHVNSPGGGALASDRIYHELAKLAAEKPLVACMGSVAASGGYYVAAAAHEIVAQPTTITGSIGVIAARLVLEPLLDRLGIVTQVLQRGAHARMLDPFLPLDEGARQAASREVDAIYEGFVQVVAHGRNRSPAEIEPLAQGRIWVGSDAQSNGLVDKLGGFHEALECVRGRIGAGADKLRVVALRGPSKLLASAEPLAARVLLTGLLEPWAEAFDLDALLLALRGERVLAWSDAAASVRV